jgi:polyisoprenyl-phosphate glycosyltransferase
MSKPAESCTILIPSFNDWEPLALLLAEISSVLSAAGRSASVLIVDDGSTELLPQSWLGDERYPGLQSIDVLRLRSNLGHQRAIALGLYHLHEFTTTQVVAIMDADGEDRPQDLPVLLAECEASGLRKVIFAARTKRMEGLAFRAFYNLYRRAHRMLTGIEVRVGNFSVVPRAAMTSLMAVPDIWNHYAAAVFRAKLPRTLVPLPRGTRLAGESKMNFVSLLMHGLGAMSVFSDQVSARLLTASAGFATLALSMIGVVVGIRIFTTLAVPGWATYTVGVLLGLVLQSMTFAILFAFLIAHRRNSPGFVPLRDAPYFILTRIGLRAPANGLAQLSNEIQRAQFEVHR